jgi:undecaprenyl-phosphate alpha-N-acetylglucosaminyl 1-phosphatetransferase
VQLLSLRQVNLNRALKPLKIIDVRIFMFQIIQTQFSQVLTVVLLTIFFNLILNPIAHKISFVDKPNVRKVHQSDTPLIGGICIFLALTQVILIFGDLRDHNLLTLIFFAGLFLCLGIADDYLDCSAKVKLLIQIIFSFIFVYVSGIKITNLGSFFGSGYSLELGLLSFPITLLAIVGLTNAFNMIDGCDGLAGCLALLACLALLYFGSSHFGSSTRLFLLILLSSGLTFLLFNFSSEPRLKAFLGDGGSLFFGFVVSVLLVNFSDGNEDYSPSMVLWFVAVPTYDFVTVLIRRLLRKRNLMVADKSHLHHYILSFGLPHYKATIIILFIAIVLLALGVFLETNFPSLSLFAFLGLLVIYLSLRLSERRTQ